MNGNITLLNRLKRKDSVTNTDVWFKTKIQNCVYKKDRITTVNGTVVSMGQAFTVLIPFTGNYLPYKDWKKLEDKTGFYTLSEQDVIILDDVIEEVIDKYKLEPSNYIVDLLYEALIYESNNRDKK